MDKYDRAIVYLLTSTNFKKDVDKAWGYPTESEPGCLFLYATPTGDLELNKDGDKYCGCLTQIKRGDGRPAYTEELTRLIETDARIPSRIEDVSPEDLPAFAEWQRKLDCSIRKTK